MIAITTPPSFLIIFFQNIFSNKLIKDEKNYQRTNVKLTNLLRITHKHILT